MGSPKSTLTKSFSKSFQFDENIVTKHNDSTKFNKFDKDLKLKQIEKPKITKESNNKIISELREIDENPFFFH